jgi:hypothetical protein
MIQGIFSSRRIARATVALALLVIGCSDKSGVGKTARVVGKITVNGEPLTLDTATVLFRPDKIKGNTSAFEPAGQVDEDGSYTLYTNGKEGAPPGWYLVEVYAILPRTGGYQKKRPAAGEGPVSLIDSKYSSVKTSGLAKEVVENPSPGAYDLELTNSTKGRGSTAPPRPRR